MATTNSGGTTSPVSSAVGSTGKTKRFNKRLMDVPVVKKPNLDEYQSQIHALQKDVDNLHKKLDGVNTRMTELTKGNADFRRKREDLRLKIDAVQEKMDNLETVRNRYVNQIEETARSGRDTKTKIQELKKALGFQTSGEIDEKIRLIEKHLMMERLTVSEENKFISEIRRLEKSKPLVDKYATMETETNNNVQNEASQLKINFDNIKEEIKILQQSKRDLNTELSTLMMSHNKAVAPVRDVSDEKDEIKRQLVEKRAKVNELRAEMYAKRREYEAYQAIVSRAQRDSMVEERKRFNVERQREQIQNALEEIEDDGVSPEMQLITQTVAYLKKLLERGQQLTTPAVAEDDKENSKSMVPMDVVREDGMVAMMPKKDRVEEYYFKPTKKKAEKKPNKKQLSSALYSQPIAHDITTLSDFVRLGASAPLTLQDCPSVLKTLEERLDSMKQAHSRSKETVDARRIELLAKLEALQQDTQPAKSLVAVPVEIEAV